MRGFAIAILLLSLVAACATTEANAHSDGCSRKGDVAGINCQLAKWVNCSGGAHRATSFNAHERRFCTNVHRGYIVATKHPVCGRPITITNARTGASVSAVEGDKGPATIALVDLSHETAAAIGIHGSGCVYVNSSGRMEAGAQ